MLLCAGPAAASSLLAVPVAGWPVAWPGHGRHGEWGSEPSSEDSSAAARSPDAKGRNSFPVCVPSTKTRMSAPVLETPDLTGWYAEKEEEMWPGALSRVWLLVHLESLQGNTRRDGLIWESSTWFLLYDCRAAILSQGEEASLFRDFQDRAGVYLESEWKILKATRPPPETSTHDYCYNCTTSSSMTTTMPAESGMVRKRESRQCFGLGWRNSGHRV